MTRNKFLCIAGSVLLSTIMVGCSGGSDQANNNHNRLVPAVEAVKAEYGSLPLVERLSGIVKAKNQVEIYPEISAIVKHVYVQNGDEVKKDEPLAQLRDREFQERLKQAKASLQIAQAQARQAEARQKEAAADLKRNQALAEKGLTNEAALETVKTKALSAEADVQLAKARVEQATATVAEQKELLAQTVIRAPVAGTVGNRNAEVGMTVAPSTKMFTLGQLDNVRVEIVLTDRMLTYIEAGQRVEIQAPHLSNGIIDAKLSRISPFLNPTTHSTDAEIDMPNPGHKLKSGMFVTVDVFHGESDKATLVPLSALYENPFTGGTGVFATRDTSNKISREPSEASSTGGTLSAPVSFSFVPVEVVAKGRMDAGIRGIDPGEWIVTIGQDLFGGDSGTARVRPVEWSRVERLQNLQREDLLEEVVSEQQSMEKDSTNPGI